MWLLFQDAFDILGFNKQEVENVYKLTACVMHMGEMKFKQRGREEQAEPDGTEVKLLCFLVTFCHTQYTAMNARLWCRILFLQVGEKLGTLMGVDSVDLYKNITKPKIKVGNEFVAKGMNVDQCNYSIGALAKSLYDRLFRYLVSMCNRTLETGQKRATFIGVLDIAGFEIFDVSCYIIATFPSNMSAIAPAI